MSRARRLFFFTTFASALTLASCGGGGSIPVSLPPPPSTTGNVQPIQVSVGPAYIAGVTPYPSINGAFTSVMVCVSGTSQCQTIGGILVDTGSEGLRVLSSALTLPLPLQTQGGNPVGECAPFIGGVVWGPVETADVEIAGEKASSVPIQVIGGTGIASGPPPTSCTNMGAPEQDLSTLGANGILGIGTFAQDCGPGCTDAYPISSGHNYEWYYSCPSSGCTPATQSLTDQVVNPVVDFPTDNNGVIIELPAIAGTPPVAASVNGSLIFGIGTQSNNGLGSATVYQADSNYGNISSVYNGVEYNDVSFIDSGSAAIFFLDPTTTGLPVCTDTGLYCPSADTAFSVTNVGYNGTSGTVNFTVENGDALLINYPNAAAMQDLAGPSTLSPGSSDYFDWGLPFFYGRKVYVAIEGQSAPGATTPYFAY